MNMVRTSWIFLEIISRTMHDGGFSFLLDSFENGSMLLNLKFVCDFCAYCSEGKRFIG